MDTIQSFLQAQLAIVGVLVPITVGLVQALKLTGLPTRLFPLVAILVGVFLQYLVNVALSSDQSLAQTILLGLIVGLSSAGLYSGVRTTAGK